MNQVYIQMEGDLFEEVQNAGLFKDSKTFPDCCPFDPPEVVQKRYYEQKTQENFNLKSFILSNFDCPKEFEE